MEPTFNFPGVYVWVSVDSDKSVCTGFKNDGLSPPTFGFDYELRILVSPDVSSTRILANLWTDEYGEGEAWNRGMGLPHSDMLVRVSGNQIMCRIPMRYLRSFEPGGSIVVRSADYGYLSVPTGGHDDRLPDTGAWDLGTGVLVPKQSCLQGAAPVHASDPEDDTRGVGRNNDELVGLNACLGREALLLEISFKEYSASGNAYTMVFMDEEQNADTGEVHYNMGGTAYVGAEYVLMTAWHVYETPSKQVTILSGLDKGELANMLVTPDFVGNRIFATIPLECIGSPSNPNMDVMISTAEGLTLIVPKDDLPNEGILTLPMSPARDPTSKPVTQKPTPAPTGKRAACRAEGSGCSRVNPSRTCCSPLRCLRGKCKKCNKKGKTCLSSKDCCGKLVCRGRQCGARKVASRSCIGKKKRGCRNPKRKCCGNLGCFKNKCLMRRGKGKRCVRRSQCVSGKCLKDRCK